MVKSMFPWITVTHGQPRRRFFFLIGKRWQCHRRECTKPPWKTVVRSMFPRITETRGRPKILVAFGTE